MAVLGPNGAGKTTLMKHVIGLLRPESGSVVVNGTDIATLKVHEVARQVGILFQNPDEQIFNRTVLAEVEWGLLARGVTRPDAADRAFAVLEELGLSAMASTNPHELTASERQLVAFASVLVTNPQLIVLDEPTKALDDQAAEKLAAAVDRRLAQGAAVLLVTHDVRFADRIATRRVMLTDGQLAAIPTE